MIITSFFKTINVYKTVLCLENAYLRRYCETIFYDFFLLQLNNELMINNHYFNTWYYIVNACKKIVYYICIIDYILCPLNFYIFELGNIITINWFNNLHYMYDYFNKTYFF